MTTLALHVVISGDHRGVRHTELNPKKQQGLTWEIMGQEKWKPELEQWMSAYAKGKPPTRLLPLDLSDLPPFTQLALQALQEVGFGQTSSYRGIAENLFKPRAARAVGNACGRNPMPLLIPCHRILAADGTIGGFSLGLPIKQQLLSFEGHQL
jgi:methylated-DNA-[protein]-cysteine S-methyltransferase